MAKAWSSREHSNVLSGLFDVKLKLALVRFVTGGGLSVRVTTGRTVSMSHE